MSDKKDRNLPLPGISIDPGYIDNDKLQLPKGNFNIEIPVDSFYNFIDNPEKNRQVFEDLLKSLSEGGLVQAEPPTLIGTKESIDKAKDTFGQIPPIPPLQPMKSILEEVGDNIMTNLGVPMDMISVGTNKNGRTYSSDAINKAINANGDVEALRNEMSILKEKNDKYLELIQIQADALKEKDKQINQLKEALNAALERELQYKTSSQSVTTIIQPTISTAQSSTSTMNMGTRFSIRR